MLPEEEEEGPEDLLEPRFFLEPTGAILGPSEEPSEEEEALATTDNFAEPEVPGELGVPEELVDPPFGCFPPRFIILFLYTCSALALCNKCNIFMILL